jgi:hypothetical protein
MIQEKIDKNVFEVRSLKEERSGLNYWLGKTAAEPISAIEIIRKINYGSDSATGRLQRIFKENKKKK